VDDSDWEPDGLTTHVRFCEGGGTYRILRESRCYSPVLVDALHLSRSGGSPADLEILDPAWLSYCQICDARAARPTEVAELRNEARTGRLYPGQGTLPLTDLLDALPEGIPLGVEAPCAEYADRSPIERGKLCGGSTHRFLDEYRQHRAGVGRASFLPRVRRHETCK
jgi:hypothetical protein